MKKEKNNSIDCLRPNMNEQQALDIQSQTINWLRFPFLFMVVFAHVSLNIFDFSSITLNGLNGNDFNILLFSNIRKLADVSISGFFIFSGYLFFRNVKKFDISIYFAKLKSRVFTLAIPYFLWLIIGVSVGGISRIIADYVLKGDTQESMFAEWLITLKDRGILSVFWDFHIVNEANINILGQFTSSSYPYVIPLWFLQDLIILALLSPLIYLLVKHLKIASIIIVSVFYITNVWFAIPSPKINALFFFVVGAYFGIFNKNLIFELRKHKTVLFITAIVTFFCSFAGSIVFSGKLGFPNFVDNIFFFPCTLSVLVIASYLIEKGKARENKLFSNSLFFVYAMHSIIVLTAINFIFGAVVHNSDFWLVNTIRVPVVTLATTLLCVFVYWFLTKFKILRPIAKVLSGNR